MVFYLDLIGALLGLGAALFFAVSVIFVRKATVTGEPLAVVHASAWVAVLVFLPISLVLYYPNFGLTTESLLAFAGAGIIGTILGRFLYFSGTKRIGASRSEPITRASLLVSTLIGVLILSETATIGHLLGIILLLVGVIIVGYEVESGSKEKIKNFRLSLGFLLPLGSMIFFGFADPLIKVGLSEGTPISVGLTIQFSVSLIVLSIYYSTKRRLPFHPFLAKERKHYILAGLAATMAMGFLFSALSVSRVVVAVPLKSTSPLLVLILSYFYLERLEEITRILIIGSICVVLGAALIGLFM
ncbi:MAG: DMT family transporter [Hadesarchaea archaeon]|nr:DMT family transporter [Hadesarchaea archaeon]